MTATECIAKFGLKLGEQNGVRGVRVTRKATAAEMATLKGLKDEIMAELEAAAAKDAAEQTAMELARAQEVEEYARTADLRRCLVCISKEYRREWDLETLEYREGRFVAAKHLGAGKRRPLFRETPIMGQLMDDASLPFGFCAMARGITAEEEALIIAEQKNAPTMDGAHSKRDVAMGKRAEKIEMAMRTGEPVEISREMVPCDDPREECSADLVVETAMPDGSVVTRRQHTW